MILPANTPVVALDSRTPTFAWDSTDDGYQYSVTSYSLYLSVDSLFEFVNINESLTENSFTPSNPLAWGTRYWWKVRAQHQFNRERWSEQVFSFRTMTLGDANGNARVDVSDIVFIVSFIFAHGAAPMPLIAGDVNCDAKINIGDAVYLVNYVFISGPPPCDGFTTMAPTIQFWPEDGTRYQETDSVSESDSQ
ncbi:MAG: dockerin type I repeat-containing protein [bacterium]|nr:dockerin type I repeat-containing protein [bacterium]